MKIALLHHHYDANHLAHVTTEMVGRGAPVIKAVWLECHGLFAALEGCHRIRAAKALGLTPIIEPVDYSDDAIVLDGNDDGLTISQICDQAHQAHIITFDD